MRWQRSILLSLVGCTSLPTQSQTPYTRPPTQPLHLEHASINASHPPLFPLSQKLMRPTILPLINTRRPPSIPPPFRLRLGVFLSPPRTFTLKPLRLYQGNKGSSYADLFLLIGNASSLASTWDGHIGKTPLHPSPPRIAKAPTPFSCPSPLSLLPLHLMARSALFSLPEPMNGSGTQPSINFPLTLLGGSISYPALPPYVLAQRSAFV